MSLGHLYTMQITVRVWNVALVCLLVCSIYHVSGLPTDMQSDDWRASTILTSVVSDYVSPFTKPVVERVTNSTAWNLFGRAANRVQGAINLTGGFLNTYYEDHLQKPVEQTKEWVECKTKTILERIRETFHKEEHEEKSQAK